MSYASGTSVSEERSRIEIERMLVRFKASAFGIMRDDELGKIQICFRYQSINIRFEMPIPNRDDKEFTRTPKQWKLRSKTEATKAYEQEIRRRWRSLCLLIKAKLIGVADKVTTFETEFLPYMVDASGVTVAERLLPMVESSMNNQQPLMLPGVAS